MRPPLLPPPLPPFLSPTGQVADISATPRRNQCATGVLAPAHLMTTSPLRSPLGGRSTTAWARRPKVRAPAGESSHGRWAGAEQLRAPPEHRVDSHQPLSVHHQDHPVK